ncbi:hypothetical protein [Nonomuraea sp. C10]|uniref:hypothetical protein n=1 Tax=Nonomuraea sp. C10 TaxID=2600577 RepID=UPI0011CE2A3D|nr:hypothetical protein [Nonomuraea sp. C10]TXK35121.1 hypothetical protein FR742_38320 [Nonomuraea sp. C10]
MYIARVRLQRFRGFAEQVIIPRRHVAIVGEPRAGRTDLITAVRRVLDPRSTSRAPDLSDLHQSPTPAQGSEEVLATEVEVTLLGLDPAREQDLHERLELIDPNSGLPADQEQGHQGQLGVRICYRLYLDEITGEYEHMWLYPATGAAVPRAERLLLAVVVIGSSLPLQLRAGGVLRRLANDLDADGLATAFRALGKDVTAATGKLAKVKGVEQSITAILGTGAAQLLELDGPNPQSAFAFTSDDGSGEAVLRRLQATLALDGPVALPLSSHGSTTSAVLSVAEAMVASAADLPGAIILADDFGDDLDAAAGETLAALLRRKSGQAWISTRRPEVVRAFDPTEVLRLTCSHGERRHHQLVPTTDRKLRVGRRSLFLLLPAMTTKAVALLEGPHDLEGYGAVAARRVQDSGTLPPSAFGVRLVAPGVADGGKDQLPKLARLANDLGFHVRVVLDNDKPGSDEGLIEELKPLVEQIIRLPAWTAIEKALVRGLLPDDLRSVLASLNDDFGLGLDVLAVDDLEGCLVTQLKKKGGLHQPFVDALPSGAIPPLAAAVLDALSRPCDTQVLVEVGTAS